MLSEFRCSIAAIVTDGQIREQLKVEYTLLILIRLYDI